MRKTKTPRISGSFSRTKRLESLEQIAKSEQDEASYQCKESTGKGVDDQCTEDAINTKNYRDPKRDVSRGGKFHYFLLFE